MNLDDIYDFDPAAFGFSGFGGGKSKGKAAAAAIAQTATKAKHVAAAMPVTVKASPARQKDAQSEEMFAEAGAASSTLLSEVRSDRRAARH